MLKPFPQLSLDYNPKAFADPGLVILEAWKLDADGEFYGFRPFTISIHVTYTPVYHVHPLIVSLVFVLFYIRPLAAPVLSRFPSESI